MRIEQVQEILGEECHRIQHRGCRQHFRRQHPHQNVLGMASRIERHGIGRGHPDKQGEDRRKNRRDDRIDREAPIVVVLGHVHIVFECRREHEQEFGFHRVGIGLEARQHHPENGEEKDQRHQPGKDRQEDGGEFRALTHCRHPALLNPSGSCRRCGAGRSPRCWP